MMPRSGKSDNKIIKYNYPIIKADLALRDYAIHLGPFMPFNSSGFATPIDSSSHVIKSNTTIKIAVSKT
jgi:hypothetical protein